MEVVCRISSLILGGALLLSSSDLCHAQHDPDGSRDSEALRISQAAIGRQLGEYHLTTKDGRQLRMSELRGQPLVLSLIYTSCFHICPTLTAELARAVDVAREALGENGFTVITVGFDVANDTPTRMAAFARERNIEDPNWYFVSTDSESIERLAQDIGFRYERRGGGFDHLTMTSVIDQNGVLYRQIYGVQVTAPALVEPLKQLVYGRRANAVTLSGWMNGLKLFCTVYDPASGRYRFDYSVFVGIIAGIMSLGAVAIFIFRAWRESSRIGSSK